MSQPTDRYGESTQSPRTVNANPLGTPAISTSIPDASEQCGTVQASPIPTRSQCWSRYGERMDGEFWAGAARDLALLLAGGILTLLGGWMSNRAAAKR